MIDWLFATTEAPNWIWIILASMYGLAVYATLDSINRLERSEKNWREAADFYNRVHLMLRGEEE